MSTEKDNYVLDHEGVNHEFNIEQCLIQVNTDSIDCKSEKADEKKVSKFILSPPPSRLLEIMCAPLKSLAKHSTELQVSRKDEVDVKENNQKAIISRLQNH
ncbi:uncharacterized protein LOC141904692 isoform X2 [Tubulanus polymorphus]|uniref:uncharacterized protein LOC141904692 isoform X2 n=1 Tax=Tubulanus polymorphus TaxID=672921 RepID=UPI003DA5A5E1